MLLVASNDLASMAMGPGEVVGHGGAMGTPPKIVCVLWSPPQGINLNVFGLLPHVIQLLDGVGAMAERLGKTSPTVGDS